MHGVVSELSPHNCVAKHHLADADRAAPSSIICVANLELFRGSSDSDSVIKRPLITDEKRAEILSVTTPDSRPKLFVKLAL